MNIFIAGDSTASNKAIDKKPEMGWGEALDKFFSNEVSIKNHATNGRSSKSFIDEGRLNTILAEIKEHDYLFIQFGHNDQKDDEERFTDPYTTYKDYLTQYIEGAREKGAIPILLTSICRRDFISDGTLKNTHGAYPDAMKELAKEQNVPLIDMTIKTKIFFESLGEEKTKEIFLWLAPGEHENYPNGVEDNTHLHEKGALAVAQLVVEGIEELNLLLKEYILD